MSGKLNSAWWVLRIGLGLGAFLQTARASASVAGDLLGLTRRASA